MNKKILSLDYIKRLAKKLRKDRNITHTQALELIAIENGYSNWIHCKRVFSQGLVPLAKQIEKPLKLNFTQWLTKHKNRNSPLGDLSSDMLRAKDWPSYSTLEEYRNYLSFKGAAFAAIKALEKAWKSHSRYLKRPVVLSVSKHKGSAQPNKKNYPPKIVFVGDVIPISYEKRTVEKFNVGDAAWISWNGRKAIPVTIVEVDDRHYTFNIERPLKKAGDQHYLFLDEVRSTPELACINYVTN